MASAALEIEYVNDTLTRCTHFVLIELYLRCFTLLYTDSRRDEDNYDEEKK